MASPAKDKAPTTAAALTAQVGQAMVEPVWHRFPRMMRDGQAEVTDSVQRPPTPSSSSRTTPGAGVVVVGIPRTAEQVAVAAPARARETEGVETLPPTRAAVGEVVGAAAASPVRIADSTEATEVPESSLSATYARRGVRSPLSMVGYHRPAADARWNVLRGV